MSTELANEFQDVLAELSRCEGTAPPAGLEGRIADALASRSAPTTPPSDLDELYREYQDDAFGFLCALLGDEALAREGVEEVFFRAHLHFEQAKKSVVTVRIDWPALLELVREVGLDSARLLRKGGGLVGSRPFDRISAETRALLLGRCGLGLNTVKLGRARLAPDVGAEERLQEAAAELASAYVAPDHDGGDEILGLLALAEVELIGEADRERLDTHLESCGVCTVLRERVREATSVPLVALPDPAAIWERLSARIETERSHQQAVADVACKVSLSCCYCHSRMARPEAVFCATCLAPHHGECFQEHGRCSAPGCAETSVVRPDVVAAAAAPSRGRRWKGPLLWVGLGGVVAAAALTYSNMELQEMRGRLVVQDDEALALARAYDTTKRRLQMQEGLLQELHEATRGSKRNAEQLDSLWGKMTELTSIEFERGGSELEQRVEALFMEIEQLAQERRVEELIAKFSELREVMNEYGQAGSELVNQKRAKWNRRLQAFGEVSLSIQLQVYINEGNQNLRIMAEYIKKERFDAAIERFSQIHELCDKMLLEEREVYHRNAKALFFRGRALVERAIALRAMPGVTEQDALLQVVVGREQARRNAGEQAKPLPKAQLRKAAKNGEVVRGMPKELVRAALGEEGLARRSLRVAGPAGTTLSWELWVMSPLESGLYVYFLNDVVIETGRNPKAVQAKVDHSLVGLRANARFGEHDAARAGFAELKSLLDALEKSRPKGQRGSPQDIVMAFAMGQGLVEEAAAGQKELALRQAVQDADQQAAAAERRSDLASRDRELDALEANERAAEEEEAPKAKRPGFLGVNLAESEDGLAEINRVIEGSAAALVGIRVGDVILSVNGAKVRGIKETIEAIYKCQGGDSVVFVVRRGDSERTIVATLQGRPQPVPESRRSR